MTHITIAPSYEIDIEPDCAPVARSAIRAARCLWKQYAAMPLVDALRCVEAAIEAEYWDLPQEAIDAIAAGTGFRHAEVA